MASSPKRINPRALSLALSSMLFPLCAGLGTRFLGPWAVVCLLIALLGARALLPSARLTPGSIGFGLLAVAALEVATSIWNPILATRLYPFFMNMMMLVTFAASLWSPLPMVERFARIMESDLDAKAIRYTRRVTEVWVGFFALNASAALWTALAGTQTQWAVYNGAICYGLAALLFGGEWIVRQHVRYGGLFR